MLFKEDPFSYYVIVTLQFDLCTENLMYKDLNYKDLNVHGFLHTYKDLRTSLLSNT